jgi:hypothetical protein
MTTTHVGEWLPYLGLSPTQVAEITGLSQQGVAASVKDGVRRPRWADYLAEHLGVPTTFLIETDPFGITWGVAENNRRKLLDWAAAYRLQHYRAAKADREQLAA